MIKTGDNVKDIVIHNAILDFTNNCRLYEHDSVFSVSFHDVAYTVGSRVISDNFSQSFRDKEYEDVLVVEILGRNHKCKFLLSSNVKVGSKSYLPSRYLEKDGKLFYWNDDYYPITEEMLSMLQKYNVLAYDIDDKILFWDDPNDDSQKGADYFFCKNDFSKYRRVVTNKGLGYYNPPKIKCK